MPMQAAKHFFFADLKGGRCQWDACQEHDWSGIWLVILACAIARTCQREKMPGVEKSRGCTLRSLCLDNLGTCRKLTEFQGQLHTFFVDPWRSQSLDVFICTVFDIVPVLQLNHQPCNYPSCSTDPDICVGRQWPDTRTPVKKYTKHSTDQFSEEIFEVEIIVPLKAEAGNILKDLIYVLFPVLQNA